MLQVEFDTKVSNLNFHNGEKLASDEGCHYHYTNKNYNGNKNGGVSFDEKFVYDYPYDQDPKPKIGYMKFIGGSSTWTCGEPQNCEVPTQPPTTTSAPTSSATSTTTKSTSTTKRTTRSTSAPTCNGKHDLRELLYLSTLFYKAQRAGELPDNDVPWRRNSFLGDGSLVGHDLIGGYFDAGDYVKFGFPMASTTTVLAWGMVEFEDGYKRAGLHLQGLETIKWATDYFLKAHTGQ